MNDICVAIYIQQYPQFSIAVIFAEHQRTASNRGSSKKDACTQLGCAIEWHTHRCPYTFRCESIAKSSVHCTEARTRPDGCVGRVKVSLVVPHSPHVVSICTKSKLPRPGHIIRKMFNHDDDDTHTLTHTRTHAHRHTHTVGGVSGEAKERRRNGRTADTKSMVSNRFAPRARVFSPVHRHCRRVPKHSLRSMNCLTTCMIY